MMRKRKEKKLKKSKYGGVVIDDDYPNGIAKQIAHDLMLKSGKKVYVLALNEVVAGFQPHNDNLPPDKNLKTYVWSRVVLDYEKNK